MKKCKWAGDVNDEYCKGCDGINMIVDDKSVPCTECAGYEEGVEDVNNDSDFMSIPETEEELPFESEPSTIKPSTNVVENEAKKPAKSKKTNNNTEKAEKPKNEVENKATINKNEVSKVSEEHNCIENVSEDGIRVTSIRYTSGATVKKGDNYFKFIAEEEWDVSRIEDIQEAREKLWAKLNAEVDSQIEELNNMN